MYRAKDVMTTKLITISIDATAEEAIRTLLQHNISGAPVVDPDGTLKGIVSEFQLLEVIYSPELKASKVRDIMTREVTSVGEHALLSDIASIFIVMRIRRLPVVREGRLVGLVSRRDLLRYAVEAGNEMEEFIREVRLAAGH
jgi:CBS domain-containing protein